MIAKTTLGIIAGAVGLFSLAYAGVVAWAETPQDFCSAGLRLSLREFQLIEKEAASGNLSVFGGQGGPEKVAIAKPPYEMTHYRCFPRKQAVFLQFGAQDGTEIHIQASGHAVGTSIKTKLGEHYVMRYMAP